MTDQTSIDPATPGPRLWVEFTGLGLFVLDGKSQTLDILLIDAQQVAGIVPHHPVLMAPFERVKISMTHELPSVVTIGDARVAFWDLTGRDLTCPAPPKAPGGVTFPFKPPTIEQKPTPSNDPNAWNNMQWLADLHAVCGATEIAHPKLVTASASFTHGSMFVGMPPLSPLGLFSFKGASVPDRLYSDRGGCVCPMDAAGVTLTLTSRKNQKMQSTIGLMPDGSRDIHVAIANYAEVVKMDMGTTHFAAYYELLDSRTKPPMVLIGQGDAPMLSCIPPFLMINRL